MASDERKPITAFEAYHWIGQTLYCKDGSSVQLVDYDANNIIIEYKNVRYSRPRSILGKSLFSENPTGKPLYYPGQKLFCTNGEPVNLLTMGVKYIRIEYHGRKYVRSRSYLGNQLFVEKPIATAYMQKVMVNKVNKQKTTKLSGPKITHIPSSDHLMSYSKTCAKLATPGIYKPDQIPHHDQKWVDDSEPKQIFSAQQMGKWPNYKDMRKRYGR